MRSLLLCAALLALLAAPALANKGKYPPKPKPAPRCDPTGTFLVDGKGVGFDGKDYTWTPNDKNLVDIMSKAGLVVLPPSKDAPDGFYLNGIVGTNSAGQLGLTYVAWSYGATVSAEIKQTGLGPKTDNLLLVALNGKPLRPGKRDLGPLLTIESGGGACNRWTKVCEARKVTITVRTTPRTPAIVIEFTQPWIAPQPQGPVVLAAKGGHKDHKHRDLGAFADYLEVKVTVPGTLQVPLSGFLGRTYTTPLKQQLVDARIIKDVINNVVPQCGLTVETAFPLAGGDVPFSNGQLLDVADTGIAPTLAIKGAKPLERFVLFVLDPDAPSAATPTDRSFLHGLWWDIPADGDLTKAKEGIIGDWVPPTPPAGSGTHRYVAVLYRQPRSGVAFVPKDPADPTKLAKYNVNLVAKIKGLGEPIYATWFTLDA